MATKIEIFDSTLRDGAQGGSINFSVEDKLNIMRALDEFGVSFIEAGNPASNPKDNEFFERAKAYPLKNAKLTAFGSTRKKGMAADEDSGVLSLLSAGTEYVSVFGKSWDMHVTEIIRTTYEENLSMISDTVEFFTGKGVKVLFDAEHFFDGYKANPEYAVKTLKAAEAAGAVRLVLCDTNGGCFPDEIFEIVSEVMKQVSIPVGIHCHNDGACAVANSLAAVRAGASHIQGTFTGIGERCGNTSLSAVIANLQLKLGYSCVPEESMTELTKTARRISEICNIKLDDGTPYVGKNAFAHKGGMHADGVLKNPKSFEHIPPESVGNKRNVLLSEVAGRSAIISRLRDIAPDITRESEEAKQLIDLLKFMEHNGYQYEAADASFELLVKKHLGRLRSFFEIVYFKIIGEQMGSSHTPSSAIVKIKVGERYEIAAGEGNGPVDAVNTALRTALSAFYPQLSSTHLIDYKVRVMNSGAATAAVVRVLIESSDGEDVWTTVGASTDIINASVSALVDSLEYKLMRMFEAALGLI